MDNIHYSNIQTYVKSSQHICICSTLSIVLILLFMISPLNQFFMTSIFGKTMILLLLGYTLFYNIQLTNKLSKEMNVYLLDNSWSPVKPNIICSWIFSLFLVVLILSILRMLF